MAKNFQRADAGSIVCLASWRPISDTLGCSLQSSGEICALSRGQTRCAWCSFSLEEVLGGTSGLNLGPNRSPCPPRPGRQRPPFEPRSPRLPGPATSGPPGGRCVDGDSCLRRVSVQRRRRQALERRTGARRTPSPCALRLARGAAGEPGRAAFKMAAAMAAEGPSPPGSRGAGQEAWGGGSWGGWGAEESPREEREGPGEEQKVPL